LGRLRSVIAVNEGVEGSSPSEVGRLRSSTGRALNPIFTFHPTFSNFSKKRHGKKKP